MSVEINWLAFTQGEDGAALAETMRQFVHERFQQMPLPRLIRSIECHAFDFGSVAPTVELKDICDPLTDFYASDDDPPDEAAVDATTSLSAVAKLSGPTDRLKHAVDDTALYPRRPPDLHRLTDETLRASMSAGTTPAFPRGTSNLGYFHLPLSAGLSGTATPLAAVAGAHFPAAGSRPDGLGGYAAVRQHHDHHRRRRVDHSESHSSLSPASTAATSSRHPSPSSGSFGRPEPHVDSGAVPTTLDDHRPSETSPNDLQVIFHAAYAGDVKLCLTADVFLDYPMPSFVGIPLKLNITGLKFDGVGIMAYVKRKAHLCFLSPEDAEALIGPDNVDLPPRAPDDLGRNASTNATIKFGGLIEEIRIESEIGETDNGKQVLKNVDKIEKFILEKVRQIFEDEFVYPSYWTFLL